jgi:hypothetical protein
MFPTIKLNIERWKYNPTFELYVSNMGHIRNKSKADIAPKIMENGYMVVYVNGSINGYMLLHRVVMLTWKPTPEAEHLTVDHKDHNKRNNALSNLEWVTFAENQRRAAEDLIGTTCPNGCEYIKRLTFTNGIAQLSKISQPNPNSKTSQKKARSKAYFDKMSKCVGFELVATTENAKKYIGGEKYFVPNSPDGFAALRKQTGNYTTALGYFRQKCDDMISGANRSFTACVCSVRITPVFDEPAAEKGDKV